MIRTFQITLYFLLFLCTKIIGQTIDVTSYNLEIHLSDSSDVIHVKESVVFDRMSKMSTVVLDLVAQDADQTGMKVSSLKLNGTEIPFKHDKEKLLFEVDNSVNANRTNEVSVEFSGIPRDGLIIGKNKFGNRTFFGDNWPNRAHHWFACNDHPSDKAIVNFSVYAPKNYEIIANGELVKKELVDSKIIHYSYKSDFVLPTKVMVFGAADFSVKNYDEFNRFPLSAWVYPENEKAGFSDMSLAIPVLNFFEEKIAPYPYEQLANVQSTTRYGGMENAGCIFYAESAIRGDGKMESLIAHEIAHQWFGNSASEKDWEHLWLSEGFATYLTHLYTENKYGKEKFKEELWKDRTTVGQFYRDQKLPLVDTISTDLLFMLNTNAYQRGSWVLHMLRNELGDELFWKGIRFYYESYKYSNASSSDFIKCMESTSGKELGLFKKQWLHTAEIPELDAQWKTKRNKLTLSVIQSEKTFIFPLEFKITYKDGSTEIISLQIKDNETLFTQKMKSKVRHIVMDPDVKLLFVPFDVAKNAKNTRKR